MTDTGREPAQPCRVLIVDDDELLRELLEFKLSQLGLAVTGVGDGETALEVVMRGEVDLVILDGMMPGLDGFEVLRRLKENEITRSLPVVLLTARKMESDIVSGLTLGADEYVVKPFMPEELIARIRRLLGAGCREE